MIASRIIERLECSGRLSSEEYALLLSPDLDEAALSELRASARRVADGVKGRKVWVRGLLEITSTCRNNCFYCGLRRDNKTARRYCLTLPQILSACSDAYHAGFRSFVLQGGENPALKQLVVVEIVAALHRLFPDAAITLSLGEWPFEAFKAFREAGASRYLLRHETFNPAHYAYLHPEEMSRENRLRCLESLKSLGYQAGTGIMVGAPGQTIGDIVADLEFMARLQPEMIGIGPFIPAANTPFAAFPAGSVELTIRLISILRLMFPYANIPSTTALASLSSTARIDALLAGANVVMPNISPLAFREAYSIYDNKAATGLEAAEGLALLREQLRAAGLELSTERGDFKKP